MATSNELKELMRTIGVKEEIANSVDPAQPLSLYEFDSLDWPAFITAVEDRYGVKISDVAALKLKTLNDFVAFIAAG